MKGSISAYNVDAIVFTGAIPENLLVQNDMWSNKITCEDANIWNIPNSIQVLKAPEQKVRLGCARFANRMAHHKLSFYDECEALSLVVQTSDEDLKFKTLIAASEKLEGGLMINGEEVSGIKMQGGEELVKFYLRLGSPKTDGKLRIYNQILELDNDLIDNTRDIPLTLQARLIAGQGRAKVEIKPANKEDLEIFNGTMLNWETMELAVIEGTSQPKTLQYMIDHLERTFPINMDNVLAKPEWKSEKRKNNIERYLYKPVDSYDYSDALRKVSLNDPSWPNKNATDLTRFEKQNMFGSDQGDLTGLPQNASDCQLAKRLLEKLKNDYDALKYNEYRANEFKTVMRHISWTYQSKFFESIAVDILRQIEIDSRKAKREQLNICANLLRTNEHKIRLFKVFMRLSEIGKANSSSIKAMLEVFMHNTSFLDEANISKSQYYKVVQHMLHLYTEELRYNQYTYRKTILQFLTFYLKVRRVYPTFCKENSPENIDRYYYKEIKDALEYHSSSRTLQWQEILSLYLDGKGNLDLPVDEIGMDDGDED